MEIDFNTGLSQEEWDNIHFPVIYDACWKEYDIYFDIMYINDRYKWVVDYNNIRLKAGFETRREARKWVNDPSVRVQYKIPTKRNRIFKGN